MEYGRKITLRAARVNAGLTLEEARKLLKVSKNTLIKWENGESTPTWEKVQMISEVYKWPSDLIIFLRNESA